MILGLVRLAFGLAALGLGVAAIAAKFGYAVSFLDLLNHFQLLLIAGSAIALIGVLVLFGGSAWQWPLAGVAVLGLVLSATTVMPDVLAGLAPRAPLPTDGRPVLKLMTHNLFGLNYDMERVRHVIAAENPDIIALQEYFPEQRGPLAPLLRDAYPYSVYCVGGKRANIAIYSKLPFVQTVDGDCTTDMALAGRTAHLLVNFTLADGRQFAVLTTHFEWPLPLERLRRQTGTILAAIKGVSVPLLVVGDFNSAPWSYEQRRFADLAGLTRQTHGTVTWPLRFWIGGWRDTFPVLPLDQVMSKGDIAIHELHAAAATGSDHLPLVVTFSVGTGTRTSGNPL